MGSALWKRRNSRMTVASSALKPQSFQHRRAKQMPCPKRTVFDDKRGISLAKPAARALNSRNVSDPGPWRRSGPGIGDPGLA